jgi:hypothetical protein
MSLLPAVIFEGGADQKRISYSSAILLLGLMIMKIHGVVTLLILTLAAVMVSGCQFGSTPLDEISVHLTAAADALEELNLVEGKTNTFTLDEEIFMIDQIFSEMDAISEDDIKDYARYHAYSRWTDVLKSTRQILRDDYHSYRAHLSKAEQYYGTFNYVGWRQELNQAGDMLDQMSGKAVSAASNLDQIPESDISSGELTELRRTRTAIMDIYRQCIELQGNLKDKAEIR